MAKLKCSYGGAYEKSTIADKPKLPLATGISKQTKTLKSEPSLNNDGIRKNKNLEFDPRSAYTFLECKKENLNDKINDRHLVKRNTQNPFFLTHDYVNDMEVRNNFLIPRISEKEKTV